MSEVHDTRESFMHEIDTNHLTITNSKTAVKREDGLKVNSKFDDFRPLKYYTQMNATFPLNNRTKRIYVVIWNAKYEAVSSVQLLFNGGFRRVMDDWKSIVFSLSGIGYILFALMIALMLFGGRTCERVNESKQQRIEADRAQYYIDVLDGLRDDTGFEERKIDGMWEDVCQYQELALGQVAIAVLVVSVLRQIIPRMRSVGQKNKQAREAEEQKKSQ